MNEEIFEEDIKSSESIIEPLCKSKKVKKSNKRTEIINKLVEAVKKGDNAMVNKYKSQLNNINK